VQGLKDGSSVGKESMIEVHKAKETTQVTHSRRLRELLNGFHAMWEGTDSSRVYPVAEEVDLFTAKLTLIRSHDEIVFLKAGE
jgi:hypothetical protein